MCTCKLNVYGAVFFRSTLFNSIRQNKGKLGHYSNCSCLDRQFSSRWLCDGNEVLYASYSKQGPIDRLLPRRDRD
ncbi:hypothetical protein VNO77_06047 [Canavalia gladiata]|uniref:Uncharacterized protein n=1 Tax=Canavalia gladiata TaxID=3824 RepID=A0AAN9R975_CANGL